MQVSIEEIAMLIGSKDIEIMSLQKQLDAAQKRIAELEPKPDVQPELKAVS
jgi:hypothetical protein